MWKVILICMMIAALLILLKAPYMYTTQPYVLIHWFGLAFLVMVLCLKVSFLASAFLKPKFVLISLCLQLLFLPWLVQIIMTYLHVPYIVATAMAVSLFTPGHITKSLFVNLFMATAIYFLNWFILPYLPVSVNEGFDLAFDSRTLWFFALLGGLCFVIQYIKNSVRSHSD